MQPIGEKGRHRSPHTPHVSFFSLGVFRLKLALSRFFPRPLFPLDALAASFPSRRSWKALSYKLSLGTGRSIPNNFPRQLRAHSFGADTNKTPERSALDIIIVFKWSKNLLSQKYFTMNMVNIKNESKTVVCAHPVFDYVFLLSFQSNSWKWIESAVSPPSSEKQT